MGMSASQVRFLSLQSRKNSIGKQLLTLSNRKMALSRDMNAVALKFNNALNQTVLKWSNDSGSNYNTLTYDLMMRPNDLNTEKPYIVTKASSGEVVLNDDALTDMDGNEIIDPDTGKAISYVDIAKMISGYSGVKNDGTLVYNNAAKAISTETAADGTVKVTGGDKAIDGAYEIPNGTYDYSFGNTLRYAIFEKLGLISEEDYNKQVNLLNQLYGSEEAQQSGKYPVGSAWGDYYIAVAQFDAYDQYLKEEHPYAIADTYALNRPDSVGGKRSDTNLTMTDSANATAHDTYDDSTYIYDAKIDGREGSTTITQKSASNTGTLDNVDFTKVVTNNGGTYTVSDTPAGYNYSGYTITTTNGSSSSVNASGITGSYVDKSNILDEALENYSGSSAYITALSKKDDTAVGGQHTDHGANVNFSQSTVLIHNYKGHSYYSEIKYDSAITDALTEMCTAFFELVKGVTTVSLKDSSAATNATNATVNYLRETCRHEDHKNGDNQKDFENSRARALASGHGLGAWGSDISGHSDHTAVAVDTAAAFDVWMTFYLNFAENGGTADAIPVDTPRPEIEESDTSTETPSTKQSTSSSGGNTYLTYTEYGYTDISGNTFANTTRMKIVASTPSDGSAYSIVWKNNTTGDYTLEEPDDTSGYTKTYAVDAGETSTYYCDSAGNAATNTDLTFDGNKVYGYVNTANAEYYFTSKSAVEAYNAGNIDLETTTRADVKKIALTSSSNATSYTFDSEGPYYVQLDGGFLQDKYNTQVSAKHNDDGLYDKLKDNVNDAFDHIKDLEDQIDNLYSSADKKIMDYYDALFQRIAENGWTVDNKTSSTNTNSTKYLNNKLQNNDYFVTECTEKADESGYNYTSKMATSIKKIYSVHDDNAENEALAEYEEEKSAITLKEEKIDVIMQKLETEQESVNTMMESVQKIIQENIDKTFKMFA